VPHHIVNEAYRAGTEFAGWPTTFDTDRASVPPVSAVLTADQSRVWSSMRVLIKRVPPSRSLEGVDLLPYAFKEGHVYDLELRIANVLIAWEYAILDPLPRREKHDARGRRPASMRANISGPSRRQG